MSFKHLKRLLLLVITPGLVLVVAFNNCQPARLANSTQLGSNSLPQPTERVVAFDQFYEKTQGSVASLSPTPNFNPIQGTKFMHLASVQSGAIQICRDFDFRDGRGHQGALLVVSQVKSQDAIVGSILHFVFGSAQSQDQYSVQLRFPIEVRDGDSSRLVELFDKEFEADIAMDAGGFLSQAPFVKLDGTSVEFQCDTVEAVSFQ